MKHETAIAFILTNWPAAFPSLRAQEDWSLALKDLDPRAVLAATRQYHADSASDFKPSPGAVRKILARTEKAHGPTPEDFDARRRWDREQQIKAALSWVRNIDWLEATGKLEAARISIIDACQTIARMSPSEDDRYYAKRALRRLDELKLGPAYEVSGYWRARLDGQILCATSSETPAANNPPDDQQADLFRAMGDPIS